MRKPEPRRSNVTTSIYDPDTKNLDVTFHNGRRYRYSNVSEKHGNGMDTADSKGAYLHKHIVDAHDGRELFEPL